MSTAEQNEVIAALVEKQTEDKLSDRHMGRALGVSASLWTRVRLGQRPINVQILRGAVRSFGVGSKVLSFLERELPVPTISGHNQQHEER